MALKQAKELLEKLGMAGQLNYVWLDHSFSVQQFYVHDEELASFWSPSQKSPQNSPAKFAQYDEFVDHLRKVRPSQYQEYLHFDFYTSFLVTAIATSPETQETAYLLTLRKETQHHSYRDELSNLETTLNTGVWRYNLDSLHFYGSTLACQLLNISPQTPPDMALEVVPFTTKSLIKLKSYLRTNHRQSSFSENLELQQEGHSRWLKITGNLKSDENSHYIVGTVTDHTEKMYNEEQQRLGIEAGSVGLWLLDLKQDKLLWNKQMFEIYDLPYQSEPLEYKDWKQQIHYDDLASTEKAFHSSIKSQQDFLQIFRIVTSTGETRFIKAKARTIYNDRRQPLKMIGVTLDISDLKAEEQRVQNERDKRFTIERLAAIGELAAGIGHEINNPLAIMLGQLEMLASQTQAEHQQNSNHMEKINSIREAGFRIRDIVNGLKSMSRDEQTDSDVQINVNDLLAATERFTQKLYHHCTTEFLYQHNKQALLVSGHFGELQQVLLNLIQNAKDATDNKENACVSIDVYQQNPETVTISVTDNGEGIPSENINTIFDSFYTTKPVNKGTGLGLSIVKRIVEQHKGHIEVRSQPSTGTTFSVTLPVVSKTTASVEQETYDDELVSSDDLKLYLVDDERDLLEICQSYLGASFNNIVCFDNAESAISGITSVDQALLVTDYTLPGMTGAQLLAGLQEKFSQTIPAILMTGGITSDKDTNLAHDMFTATIQKPFKLKDLLNKINHINLNSKHRA